MEAYHRYLKQLQDDPEIIVLDNRRDYPYLHLLIREAALRTRAGGEEVTRFFLTQPDLVVIGQVEEGKRALDLLNNRYRFIQFLPGLAEGKISLASLTGRFSPSLAEIDRKSPVLSLIPSLDSKIRELGFRLLPVPKGLARSFSSEVKFERAWGRYGNKKGQFDYPTGIAIFNSRVYVTDRGNHRVQVFSLEGAKRPRAGSEEGEYLQDFGKDRLDNPIAVAIEDNLIYVADSHGIQVFELDKDKVKFIRRFGDNTLPAGLAIESGKIYVTDSGKNRVIVFDREGKTLQVLRDKEFNRPAGIAIGDQEIYVSDSLNHRVKVLDWNGKIIQSWDEVELPKGIALSGREIYVVDSIGQQVKSFDVSSGKLLRSWGEFGVKEGQFRIPEGIAISGQRIYVTDALNSRVQVFRLGS
jgi:DNA-binding beta-propeller fold protein YncE